MLSPSIPVCLHSLWFVRYDSRENPGFGVSNLAVFVHAAK
jgi:hypothetical protein